MTTRVCTPFLIVILLLGLSAGLTVDSVHAQDRPPERQLRTYIPPDQLVSFQEQTSFEQFVDFLNPIFERVTGKEIVDPESRTHPIGISIAGMQFFDAFELVLEVNDLIYRETDRFFIIEPAPVEEQVLADAPSGARSAGEAPSVSLDTRDIQINAILFSLDVNRAREIGLNWTSFLSGEGSGGDIQVRTDRLAAEVDDVLILPESFGAQRLREFINLSESRGVGETIASPRITVQSGETGQIQIGSDIPFVTRDFAGNTITQFVETGIIIEVTPEHFAQRLSDDSDSPIVDFVDLTVRVENSSGQVTNAGPIVDRNEANTRVVLLDGEQTIIGGLYSTEESQQRQGIPLLKDLPGWFFGIRYLTGTTTTTLIQQELLIVLQAQVVDPLRARAQRPFDEELLLRGRQDVYETIRRFNEQATEQIPYLNRARYGEGPPTQQPAQPPRRREDNSNNNNE